MFKLGEVTLTLPPSAYLTQLSYRNRNTTCLIAVSYVDNGMILGDTFMRNYVTSFDYKNLQVSLALNPNAPSGVLISGPASNAASDSDSDGLSGGAIAGIVLGALVVSLIIAFIVYKSVSKSNDRRSLT